ncbi:MAG: beta strand repeat-containing protein [Leptolyngbyaceae cyanobacterium]
MTDQLTNPILLSDNEIEIIFEDIQAPFGEPAVDIPGSETLLAVIPGGSITASDPGNTAVQASGENVTVLNLGEISGDLNGISSTGNDFRLLNIGTVQSNSRAVDLSDGDGIFVLNTGNILGTGNQRNGTLYVDGTVDDLDLLNSGTIDAGEENLGDAVSVQVGATDDPSNENINITNNGLLQGRGDGPDVFANGGRVTANGSSGLRFFNGSGQPEAAVSGSIVNHGTITSEGNVGFLGGLVVEDGVAFDGSIVNSGLISGPRNGLYIGNAEHDLSILNTGEITSGSRAVNLDGDNVTLSNQGSIVGTGDQRDGTVYLDGTADNITVNNQQGSIDAGEGNSGSGVSVQVGAANGLGGGIDDLELSADISNSGLIQGRGDSNVPAGIRLFVGAGLTEATFTGNITNELDGIVASEESAGLLIEAGVIFDGQITNLGTISGGNGFAIDADGALGSVDILNAGTLDGAVRLGAGSDRFIQTSGEDVVVTGGLGNDAIIGGDGNDILNGGNDNDILTGGLGSDTFEFGINAGLDIVTDFSTSNDLLEVETIFDNVSDVLGAATQVGTSTLIDFGNDNAVL